jgi:hypothetical protein
MDILARIEPDMGGHRDHICVNGHKMEDNSLSDWV